MSIKEALGIEQSIRISREDRLRIKHDKIDAFRSSYREKLREAGRSILKVSGASGLLQELANEIIKPDFPDVEIQETSVMLNGETTLFVRWDYKGPRQVYRGPGRPRKPIPFAMVVQDHNAISVSAYPVTEDLVVLGGEEVEILSKPQWGSDPKLLENAIAHAYQRPMIVRPPGI